ncbi:MULTISPECIES: phage tail protein [unclassified Serratia (in: enterobacteria)]|uniref:phage tail protein n=1 Tax=unclassified Serratia (in: enterobacteria) TaxID=2647522 RepID=UPI0030761B97
MVLETFNYCARVNPVGDYTFRVREVQFGDGYKQRVGDGLNNESQSWQLTFTNNEQITIEIRDFFKRHAGYKAFKWTSPSLEPGLYTCKTYQITALGKNSRGKLMFQLAATFETAFHP